MWTPSLKAERAREAHPEIGLRWGRPDDADAYTALRNRQYRRQVTAAYYDWQFVRCPGPTRLAVLCHAERVIGFYGLELRRLNDGTRCGFLVDMLIDPEYRGRGLFHRLEDALARQAVEWGAACLAVLPNASGRAAHARVSGWQPLGTIHTLELAAPPQAPLPGPPGAEVGVEVEAELKGFTRTADELEWRVAAHPMYRYDRVAGPDGTEAVVKRFADPAGGGVYGDIVAVHGIERRWDAAPELLAAASRTLFAQGATVVTLWALPHSRLHRVAATLGFQAGRQERYFCVRLLEAARGELCDFARWQLQEIDSEVF